MNQNRCHFGHTKYYQQLRILLYNSGQGSQWSQLEATNVYRRVPVTLILSFYYRVIFVKIIQEIPDFKCSRRKCFRLAEYLKKRASSFNESMKFLTSGTLFTTCNNDKTKSVIATMSKISLG